MENARKNAYHAAFKLKANVKSSVKKSTITNGFGKAGLLRGGGVNLPQDATDTDSYNEGDTERESGEECLTLFQSDTEEEDFHGFSAQEACAYKLLLLSVTLTEVAILYNDRSVLENHHVSAAYKLMVEEDMNILINLNKDDWRELRSLVIEMVMSTDMSCHFQQIKTMRNSLTQTDSIDKVKVLSLMLHAADISHPAKAWPLHYHWTHSLMEEFFRQGDKEVELGLPFSPLCDRKATMIAQSQIGFIDFIVEPTFSVLIDTTDKVIGPLIEEDRKARETGNRRPSLTGSGSVTVESVQRHSSGLHGNSDDGPTDFSLTAIDLPALRLHLSSVIVSNKERWKELSVHELANKEKEEKEAMEGIKVNPDTQSSQSGHNKDQSPDPNRSLAPESQNDGSPELEPTDHLSWNGEEKVEEEDQVPENA